jgi:hypothetical protein
MCVELFIYSSIGRAEWQEDSVEIFALMNAGNLIVTLRQYYVYLWTFMFVYLYFEKSMLTGWALTGSQKWF